MLTLNLEKGRYIRIREGVTSEDVESVYNIPVCQKLSVGMIIKTGESKRFCYAAVGDTFSAIAAREGCCEEELKEFNGGVIYPTKRIWLP